MTTTKKTFVDRRTLLEATAKALRGAAEIVAAEADAMRSAEVRFAERNSVRKAKTARHGK